MNVGRENTLRAVLRASLEGREDEAHRLLDSIIPNDAQVISGHESLQDYIFASALSRRLDASRSAEINLYLQQFELQQISLFNLLAEHLPTVRLSVDVANEILADFLADWDEVALLDLGIGTGRQEVALLRRLAARDQLPRRLTIYAVEPDPDSLHAAEAVLREAAQEFGVELEFHGLNLIAEDLEEKHWDLFGSAQGPLIMHAAFAAHHILDRDNGYCARTEFFRRLRQLNPHAVILCEPSSDHRTHLVGERFENCWRHFGLTFDLVDRAEITAREAAAIKMFFAREIQDILGNNEETRCERHESAAAWVERLRRAGFTPHKDFALSDRIHHEIVAVKPREGYVGIDYSGETLVAVICATSGDLLAERRPHQSRRLEMA